MSSDERQKRSKLTAAFWYPVPNAKKICRMTYLLLDYFIYSIRKEGKFEVSFLSGI